MLVFIALLSSDCIIDFWLLLCFVCLLSKPLGFRHFSFGISFVLSLFVIWLSESHRYNSTMLPVARFAFRKLLPVASRA